MRNLLLVPFLLALAGPATAQNGWTRISDPANPINAFATAGLYKGAAWVDVNNDGWLDLFAAPNGLFLGRGGGQFVAVSTGIGASINQPPSGCSWADLDNDGDLDVVLAQFPSAVFLNNGNATFQDVTSRFPGLGNTAAWAAAIGDANHDQQLDVLFTHANGFHPAGATPIPCAFFQQLGAGGATFSPRVTGYDFTDALGAYTVPVWVDYDLDGDQDLFIASGTAATAQPDFCYKNLWAETGTATLQRMTTEAFAAQRQDGQLYSFVDVDNDLDLDLCLTNYTAAPTRFFLNQGGQYVAAPAPFCVAAHHLSNTWGDFDNDGDQDVFITSDSQPTTYFRNDGHGVFVAAPSLSGPAGGVGLVAGDYDNDGDLDVFINGRVAAPAAVGLYRNDCSASCAWVNIRLTGTVSNRSALGARVMVKAIINGVPTWQLRTVSAQNSFQGQNDLRVHFGLSQATTVDSLVVVWPAGSRQRFGPVAPNRFYSLVEGQGLSVLTATRPAPLNLALAVRVSPVPARDFLVVELAPDPAAPPARLVLTDALGRMRCEMTAVGPRTTMPLMNLAPGVYHLEVRRGEQVFSTKVVRE